MVTFVVVRHAEKRVDDAVDSPLSEMGHARAQRLASLLGGEPLVAVYATQFRRTRETAEPVARSHGIQITSYDAAVAAGSLATQLRADHPRGTVLVVGHSNTVADIVSALSGQTVEPLTEAQFDVIHEVDVDSRGRASVTRSSY